MFPLFYRFPLLVAVILGILAGGCRTAVSSSSIVLRNVNVIAMDEPGTAWSQTIIVRDGVIEGFGSSGTIAVPSGAEVIEADGAFLLPGLWDAHVHTSAENAEEMLALFPPYGITSVRLMHGSDEHLRAIDHLAETDRAWPHVVTSGPLIAGREIHWDHDLATTPEQGRAVVARHHEAGYDFLKIYDFLEKDVWMAIVDEAARFEMPFAGHLPVSIELAVEWGQKTIEHVDQLIYSEFGRARSMEVEPSELHEIVSKLQARNVAVTPTLSGTETLMRRGTPDVSAKLERSEMRYMQEPIIEWWSALGETEPTEEALRRRQQFLRLLEELTSRLAEAGVPLLAGSDTPNPMQIPGLSLHEELEHLESIGLDRWEVLRTATANPANLIGNGGSVIREGARADLILLESNPLDDLSALRRPLMILIEGKLWTREELDLQLESVAEKRREQRAANR